MLLFSRLLNAEIWLGCGEVLFNNMKGLRCGKTDEAGRRNYSWFICKLMRGWFSGHIAIAALLTKLNNGARLSTKKFAFHIWDGDCVLVYRTRVCTWGNTCWLEMSFLSPLCCWCVCVSVGFDAAKWLAARMSYLRRAFVYSAINLADEVSIFISFFIPIYQHFMVYCIT